MAFETLIGASDLAAHLADPDWAVVDCRFALLEPEHGRRAYLQAHVPGAVYAHLNDDLSSPILPGRTGRHPLPDVGTFARTLSRWGITAGTQVVAYDDTFGAIGAARLWWMLRWLGHESVAVLDGGWQKWKEEGRSKQEGEEANAPRRFMPRPRAELIVSTDDILASDRLRLFDSRSAERYRGENETIDPVAGHIPGAASAPYSDNLAPDGRFLPASELRARYQTLLGETPADHAVFYCGSGVSSAHSILAMVHTGLGISKLYPGSWSEWITDPARPIEK